MSKDYNSTFTRRKERSLRYELQQHLDFGQGLTGYEPDGGEKFRDQAKRVKTLAKEWEMNWNVLWSFCEGHRANSTNYKLMESMFISNRLFPIKSEKALIEVINFGRNSKVESLQDAVLNERENRGTLEKDLENLKSILETLDKMLASWNDKIPSRAIDFIEHLDNFLTIISDLNLFNLLDESNLYLYGKKVPLFFCTEQHQSISQLVLSKQKKEYVDVDVSLTELDIDE